MHQSNHCIREAICSLKFSAEYAPADIAKEQAQLAALGYTYQPEQFARKLHLHMTAEAPTQLKESDLKLRYYEMNGSRQAILISTEEASFHWGTGYPGWKEGFQSMIAAALDVFEHDELPLVATCHMGYLNHFPLAPKEHVSTWIAAAQPPSKFGAEATEWIDFHQRVLRLGSDRELNLTTKLLIDLEGNRTVEFLPFASIRLDIQFQKKMVLETFERAHTLANIAFRCGVTSHALSYINS